MVVTSKRVSGKELVHDREDVILLKAMFFYANIVSFVIKPPLKEQNSMYWYCTHTRTDLAMSGKVGPSLTLPKCSWLPHPKDRCGASS